MDTPTYDNEFDAIVVGAGLAGSAAALTMADRDLDVLVLERGQSPGTKNVFGGVLYTPTVRELVDLDDAPLERYVAEKRYGMLTETDETAVTMRPGEWLEEPHNDSYTVLRGSFDEWFAEQAVAAGATLLTETTVTGLVREGDGEDGRVVGVETDRPDGTIRAPVVVVAEGANSLVSEGAGLRDHHDREDVAVAAKEVLEFDRDTIEERFRLNGDQGVAYNYFGEGAVGDAVGGGFIYTNKRTVSVGVAYSIEDAAARDQNPQDALDAFKQHPAVAPLVRGGRTVEYSAHAIPEGGIDAVPDLVSDGALLAGDAAGLVLNNGVHLEGTNMAVESGHQAGRAVAAAVDGDGRVADRALATYPEELADSFVVQNLQHYDFFQDLAVEDREFLFSELPRALADAETEYFAVDREPKEAHAEAAKDRLLDAAGGYLGAAKRAWKYRKLVT
jgi:electron transfer flavoprotein-quinone oxidoreductase